MPETSIMIWNNSGNRISLDPTAIVGDGGSAYPRLICPFVFSLSPTLPNNGFSQNYDVMRVEASLFWGDSYLKIGDGKGALSQYPIRHQNTTYTTAVEFPLDIYRIERIEQSRSGDVKFRIDLTILVALHSVVGTERIPVISEMDTRGVQIGFEIPQSHWVTKILPRLGYGLVKLIELPMHDCVLEGEFNGSANELSHAQEYFLKGDYDKSVGHCRTALETIKNKLVDLTNHITSDSESEWVKEIVGATTVWLNKIYEKTYRLTNKPHHPPSIGHFSRHDANAIMLVTTAIVSYVSRLSSQE